MKDPTVPDISQPPTTERGQLLRFLYCRWLRHLPVGMTEFVEEGLAPARLSDGGRQVVGLALLRASLNDLGRFIHDRTQQQI